MAISESSVRPKKIPIPTAAENDSVNRYWIDCHP
jgi:hypothetical protein